MVYNKLFFHSKGSLFQSKPNFENFAPCLTADFLGRLMAHVQECGDQNYGRAITPLRVMGPADLH